MGRPGDEAAERAEVAQRLGGVGTLAHPRLDGADEGLRGEPALEPAADPDRDLGAQHVEHRGDRDHPDCRHHQVDERVAAAPGQHPVVHLHHEERHREAEQVERQAEDPDRQDGAAPGGEPGRAPSPAPPSSVSIVAPPPLSGSAGGAGMAVEGRRPGGAPPPPTPRREAVADLGRQGDPPRPRAAILAPEDHRVQPGEDIGRQDRRPRPPGDLALHRMQARRRELTVELRLVVDDVLEIVLEPGLPDEIVNLRQTPAGILDQAVVLDQKQRIGMGAEIGFLDRRPGETHQPVAAGQRLGAAVNGGALLGAEHPRDLERVLRNSRSKLSTIHATSRTQAMTLASG